LRTKPEISNQDDPEVTDKPVHQPSCADPSDPTSLSVVQAQQAIRRAVRPLSSEQSVPIRAALGRVLAADCVSPLDVPAHTNSAMDGYALAGSDLPSEGMRDYEVIATALAGQALDLDCRPGQCVRIMTGAPMPRGTDTVVMQEQVELSGERRVRIAARHRAGQNVRQAGEDIARGARVFGAGRVLGAADLGVLASLGFAELRVRRRPRVAFFSTGDELRSIGEPLGEGEIYDSNRYSLHALLSEAGVEIYDLGVVCDDRQALSEAFAQASAMADVVITSGGVSVGAADYTKEILGSVGEMSFWTIAMKPGRPLTFGRIGEALFFGLPGNPVAVMLTFLQFVRPALQYLASGSWPVPLIVPAISRSALKKRPGRFEFVRGILDYDDQGRLTVGPSGAQGSGVLTSMSRANCLILLDEACAGVAEGETVMVQPFATRL
jgi:molybdopterin molybdotransferase